MLPELRNYYFKKELINNFISQLSENEIQTVNDNTNNCIYWMIGHLTGARVSMLNILNIQYDIDIPLENFKKGSSGTFNPEWPDFSKILNHFNKAGDIIFNELEKKNPGIMNNKMKYIINDEIVTIGDNLKFLIFHEDYHIGQLGLLLKLLGKKGIGV